MRYPSYNLYQAYGWGEFKRRSGWGVRRGNVLLDGKLAAVAQCLVREIRSTLTVIAWIPGGPAGTPEGRCAVARALRRAYPPRVLFYLRSSVLEQEQRFDRAGFFAAGWEPVAQPLAQTATFQLDLTLEEAVREQRLSANWRHNLRRGRKRGAAIELWENDRPLNQVYEVYREMCSLHKIRPALSLEDLEALRSALGTGFTLAVAHDSSGALCAMRGFGRIGRRAQDLIAGVSLAGRRIYANFPLTWRLLDIAREQGIGTYDLAGVDWDRAEGVANFKKGLGAEPVTFAGEWEWSNSEWLRLGLNLAIRFRRE